MRKSILYCIAIITSAVYILSTMGFGLHHCLASDSKSVVLLYGKDICEIAHSHSDSNNLDYNHNSHNTQTDHKECCSDNDSTYSPCCCGSQCEHSDDCCSTEIFVVDDGESNIGQTSLKNILDLTYHIIAFVTHNINDGKEITNSIHTLENHWEYFNYPDIYIKNHSILI